MAGAAGAGGLGDPRKSFELEDRKGFGANSSSSLLLKFIIVRTEDRVVQSRQQGINKIMSRNFPHTQKPKRKPMVCVVEKQKSSSSLVGLALPYCTVHGVVFSRCCVFGFSRGFTQRS